MVAPRRERPTLLQTIALEGKRDWTLEQSAERAIATWLGMEGARVADAWRFRRRVISITVAFSICPAFTSGLLLLLLIVSYPCAPKFLIS